MIYIKIIFVIMGTIIGAGFASGKEIYTFFCIYGLNGFLGLLISSIIIGLVIYKTLLIILEHNTKSYSDLITFLVGKNRLLNYTINNIINIFLLVSFIVMVSGFGALIKQEFNLPIIYGAIFISLLAIITFYKNMDGIIKINSFLIPFLIFLIIFLCLKISFNSINSINLVMSNNINWLIKSVLYASYNSVILIPILINLKPYIDDKKQIKTISFFTALFMIILSVVIYFLLFFNMSKINNIDIPLVYIASNFRFIF